MKNLVEQVKQLFVIFQENKALQWLVGVTLGPAYSDYPVKNRGFIGLSAALYLGGALLLVGTLGTIAYKLDSRGFERGKAKVEAQVAERDNKALKDALEKLGKATQKVRDLESKNKEDLALALTNYKKDLTNVKTQKDKVIADLNSGNLRLRVNLAGCSPVGAGSAPSATSPGGLGNNGTPQTGLLDKDDSAFLINLASEADTVVAQLTAAQAVIIKDREVCK